MLQHMAQTTVALSNIQNSQQQRHLLDIMKLVLAHWQDDFKDIIDRNEPLGRGGFGTVFAFVSHRPSGRLDATAFVGKHLRKTPREFVRLRGKVRTSQKREMVVAARCAAAGISIFPIALLHTNARQDDGLMVMERLPPGCTITAFVQRHWRDAAQMARIRKAILRTVGVMHGMGIFHGDLHGDNLWLCDEQTTAGEDHVLVLDFGRSVVLPRNVMNGIGKAMELAIMSDDYAKEHIFARWADESVYQALWVPSSENKKWQAAMQAVQVADRDDFESFPAKVRLAIDRFLDLYVELLKAVSNEEERGLLTMAVGATELTVVARACFHTPRWAAQLGATAHD